MITKKVAIIVGSLRKESYCRKVAHALIALSPKDLEMKILEIKNLPMYNQDLDKEAPVEWTDFRSKLKSFDGIIFVTPEYNRSISGVLKNAIDVGSRPYGQNAFEAKPAAVISASIGRLGAFGANHHLRQSLVFLDMPTMAQPEVYLGEVAKIFAEEGHLISESTGELIKKFANSFTEWVTKNSHFRSTNNFEHVVQT